MSKWHILEYLASADSAALTHGALTTFARGPLLADVHVRALCHGNTSSDEATSCLRGGLDALGAAPLFGSELPTQRLLQLPSGTVLLRQHAYPYA